MTQTQRNQKQNVKTGAPQQKSERKNEANAERKNASYTRDSSDKNRKSAC